ncbi:PLP-dependent aminotransferase family protein [Frigoribacterium sp. VKM Ac-2530]|uniref:MocR-like transcription factor YczR n=1 Tax=Frigoribacterium sp. VKM Ac-2530 TaxID=2783822 RepID=UPI00188AF384|nr:PLP-dependent aminotransferase family protein [Frigoribacterium sp. VKM Ac-2530]MBF4579638.1 PLP-dependent aminotransferase family protein [Frigoribacterium sp. VKM Ac-2530]
MSIVTSGPAVSSRALGVLLDSWRASSSPGYAALADRIRLLVLDGRLSVGTRLPSERDLATHLGVSRTTVAAAYAALRDAGHVTSLRGSGSVVRLPDQARVRSTRPAAEGDVLDFTKAAMPAVDGIAEAAQRAAGRLGAYLSEPGYDTVGRPVLREAIAARYRARGLETSADQIVVTLGAQHAIALLARVLVGRGDRAVVETPGYPHAFEALRAAGARLAPVSVTVDEGWDESALLQTLRRTSPPVAYLMPDFHNPTGATMLEAQRVRVLEAAADEGTIVIADETMAELVVGGPRGASFAGAGAGAGAGGGAGARPLPMAAYGPAVTIGSVGKSLWGGLRIGWIRAERPLVERLVRARSAGDLGTPVLEQLIVADLLGDMDGVLEARSRQLRHGRDRLVAGLRSAFPGWSVPSPAGGLTTWVGLGAPVSSQLVLAARRHGLLLAAGPMFGVDGAFERFLRVPYSYPDDETDRALTALAAAWDGIDGVQAPRGALMAEVV